MKSESKNSVVVVGGGVVGAMSAWELMQSGCKVTLVDQAKFGAACSHGNCGYISPSHVLPLAQPGTISKTLKSMLQPNSPFAVKPRLSLNALRWFWRFAMRCNQKDMLSAAEGIHSLLQSSKTLIQQLISEQKIECEWKEVGNLFVYEHQKDLDAFAKTEKMIREGFGVGADRLSREELVKLEPAIKPIVAGAWYYRGDCHLRPDKFMNSLRSKLEAGGVQILENTLVKSISRENSSATCIKTSRGEIAADQFVVATGAWAPFLNKELGCRIPIEPGKGYSLTMPTPRQMPQIPIIFEDTHVAITPMETKYRIGSTMEFVGYDTSIHQKRLNLLRASAEKYLVDPFCEPVEEEWFGWRPMTWDSKPIIDRSPALKNVWINAGHSMLGISTATGSARLLKELLLDQKPHLDPKHYSISRF